MIKNIQSEETLLNLIHHAFPHAICTGIDHLTEKEYLRAIWYDVYTMLLVIQECDYRQYDSRDMYEWASGHLTDKFAELHQIIHTSY